MARCRVCEAKACAERRQVKKAEQRFVESDQRLNDDYEALKPGDGARKDTYKAPDYDREKKQEYNKSMGELLEASRAFSDNPAALADFISLTAEQERRWMNKRLARSHAVTIAREMLLARQFEHIAKELDWPQLSKPAKKPTVVKRAVTVLLSDLHCGAKMPGDENPIAFDYTQFNRRLGFIALQVADYKPQYRDVSELHIAYNGDGIEGNLSHGTDFDQAPLAEQLVAFGRAMYAFVAHVAGAWGRVHVHIQGGNHGRDVLLHPGRAVTSKKANFEISVMKLVMDRCSHLTNIQWHFTNAPVSTFDLCGQTAVMSHMDTEIKVVAPSASGGHSSWQSAVDRLNAEKLWAPKCDVLLGGHFHDPALMPFDTGWGVSNGALVPPNGYARSKGFRGPCGQWLFESAPGFAVGDSRYLRVGTAQDRDSSLDAIIPPFEW